MILGWLAPALVLMLVVSLSSLPGSPRALIALPISDTVAHFSIYACLGGLLFRALWLTDVRLQRPITLIVSTLFAGGLGGLDEFYQGHVLYRTPELADLLADTAGALTGGTVMLVAILILRRRRISQSGGS